MKIELKKYWDKFRIAFFINITNDLLLLRYNVIDNNNALQFELTLTV